MTAMRLQRALARAGVASRRRSEDLIREGRVTVNGSVATLGMSVDPVQDDIRVGRRKVTLPKEQWILFNKPIGYVVSRKDPEGRSTVFELLPDLPSLTYVGRLDVMTGGCLLLTTNGTAVHRLTHPRYAVERTYRVRVHGRPTEEIRRALSAPIVIDGRRVSIKRVHVMGKGDATEMRLTLTEGRYRIVRRLCEALALKVEWLVRTQYGPIALGRLAPGKWRMLTADEHRALRKLLLD
jgi:23S rRNA pseudouridine2605 synthase